MTDEFPPFIALASSGRELHAFEHATSAEEAIAWCERQMRELTGGELEQLAVVRPHVVFVLRFGEMPILAPVFGWQWINARWQEVAPHTLQLVFDTVHARSPEETMPPNQSPQQEAYAHCAAHVANVTIAVTGLAQGLQQFRRLLMTERDRMRVMVVDDSAHVRTARRRALQHDHDVYEAESYAAALVSLATGVFDAVVADEDMGAIGSGSALLKEVRNRWPYVRRVLCSKRDFDSTDHLEPGVAHRLLVTPVDSIQLLASLR
jgi:CheY-like chemotaxis protein